MLVLSIVKVPTVPQEECSVFINQHTVLQLTSSLGKGGGADWYPHSFVTRTYSVLLVTEWKFLCIIIH
jgi:hypothetical protein